jgi:hypothetical protein
MNSTFCEFIIINFLLLILVARSQNQVPPPASTWLIEDETAKFHESHLCVLRASSEAGERKQKNVSHRATENTWVDKNKSPNFCIVLRVVDGG